MTAVLGYLAINVPAGHRASATCRSSRSWSALTVVAVVANVPHPIRWSLDEIRFASAGRSSSAGSRCSPLIATGRATPPWRPSARPASARSSPTPMAVAAATFLARSVAWAAFAVAARLGFGPLAPAPAPDEPAALLPPPAPPPAAAWLRPGAQLGLPIVWMVVCLLALPLAIYVASYLPVGVHREPPAVRQLAGRATPASRCST